MSETEHVYSPPRVSAGKELPAAVMRYLDGTDLLAKSQALRLSTIDAAGWPHASLLSAGDMLAWPSGCIRFVISPESTTVANLARDGRLTITLTLDGGMCELRLIARRLADAPGVPLAIFEAGLRATHIHVAPYADVTGGVTFKLHEPQSVLARWQRQVAALRAAA